MSPTLKASSGSPGESGGADVARVASARARLRLRLRYAKEIYEGVYIAPYRRVIRREQLRQRDLFLVLGMSDMLGIPSPVAYYTLELLPDLIEDYHEWHRRLGMEPAPEGGFRCC